NPQFKVRKTMGDGDQQVGNNDSGCVLGGAAHTHRLHQDCMGATPPPRQRCKTERNYCCAFSIATLALGRHDPQTFERTETLGNLWLDPLARTPCILYPARRNVSSELNVATNNGTCA